MRYISIVELGQIINPFPGAKVLALLSAYLDLSETNPVGITSIAGYVAPLEEWEQIDSQWSEALKYWRLKKFRLSSLSYHVGLENVEVCTSYFENIIKDSNLDAIGSALINQDWKQPDWGNTSTVRLAAAYEQCLDIVLECLAEHTKEHFKGEKISVVCDQDRSENCIRNIFMTRKEKHRQFATVTLGTSKDIIGLQCADLGAGMLRRSWMQIATDAACELPWGELPSGRKQRTSFWSLRQGAILGRALKLHGLQES